MTNSHFINIRPASVNDGQWVVALLKEGAKNKHFAPTVSLQAEAIFGQILATGYLPMLKQRNGIQRMCHIQAIMWVAEINALPAAFLITLEEAEEVELHLAGTRKQFRRKGCFRALMRHQISAKTNQKIFARCYKHSTFAIDALKREGFAISQQGEPVELTFVGVNHGLPETGTAKPWLI